MQEQNSQASLPIMVGVFLFAPDGKVTARCTGPAGTHGCVYPFEQEKESLEPVLMDIARVVVGLSAGLVYSCDESPAWKVGTRIAAKSARDSFDIEITPNKFSFVARPKPDVCTRKCKNCTRKICTGAKALQGEPK